MAIMVHTTLAIILHLVHLECPLQDPDAIHHHLVATLQDITKSTSIISMATNMDMAIMAKSTAAVPVAALIQTEDGISC
ncbi:hypothetical protein lerEdw1_004423 [Lerista edwardsae]|nr:hypothetical protein lerEdw1_004423 [Lerista edwardsae]